MTTTFSTVKLGAGGFVIGFDISSDGSIMICHTDAAGGYIWNSAQSKWVQAVDASNSAFVSSWGGDPSAGTTYGGGWGCWDFKFAPGTPSTMYLFSFGTPFKSTDSGITWTACAVPVASDFDSNNGNDRFQNCKMAVDPNNASHVIVWSQSHGAYRTTNGGTTWAQISATSTFTAGSGCVAFDTSAGTVSGLTKNIYLGTRSNGLLFSSDGGATFAATASTGPGATASYWTIAVNSTGQLFGLVGTYSTNNTVWRYSGGLSGTWTNLSIPVDNWVTLTLDPLTANRMAVGDSAGNIIVATGVNGVPTWGTKQQHSRTATDVPWLGWTAEGFMSTAQYVFDPVVANKIWFAEGIGVWHGDIGSGIIATNIAWNSQSAGIEELIVGQVRKAAGNANIFIPVEDRQLFIQTKSTYDTYPSVQFKGMSGTPWIDFGQASSFDFDPANSNYGVLLSWDRDTDNNDALFITTDGGSTWTHNTSVANQFVAGGGLWGHLAVGGTNRFIRVPGGSNGAYKPQYTSDAVTWATSTMPVEYTGDSNTGLGGWGANKFALPHQLDFDKVTAGKAYLYWCDINRGTSGGNTGGLLVSTNYGATWTTAYNGANLGGVLGGNAANYGNKLRAVPGNAGHLFFTTGANGQQGVFVRSTNGGTTWTAVSGITNVYAFGFGAIAPGQTYPSIYASGYDGAASNPGLYVSIDNCTTWTKLATYPLNAVGMAGWVDGDPDVYGDVYLAQRSMIIYGTLGIVHRGGNHLGKF